MSGTLPSANTPSLGGRVASAAARGTLRVGSYAFSRMFPTVARAMNTTRRAPDPDSINTSSEDINRNLHRQVGFTRRILDNQIEQNRLLERLLLVYQTRQPQAATPIVPPPPSIPNVAGNVEIDLPGLPDLPDRRQPPRPQTQQQRPAPNRQRSWLRRYLTYMKRRSPRLYRAMARRLVVAAAGVAAPGPGWLVALLSGLSSVFLAYEVYKVYRDFMASNSEEEDENIENDLPSEEEAAAAEREIDPADVADPHGLIERTPVIPAPVATGPLRFIEFNSRVRGSRGTPEQEQLIRSAAQAMNIDPNNVTGGSLEGSRVTTINVRGRRDPIRVPPAAALAEPVTPSREQLLAARTTQIQAMLASARIEADEAERNSVWQLPISSMAPSAAAQLAAVRVEGDTIYYDFERIRFEADLIKFDGLSLPTRNTVAEPAAAAPAAVPPPSATVAAAIPPMAATAATAGPQPMQVAIQPPTASPMIQGMMDRRQQAGTPNAGSAAAAMQFFQSRGWTPAQAAGFAANLQVESNFNPAAVGDGGRAYGIAQWHPDRQAAFQRWAGRDIRGSTFEQQLEFMQFELTQGNERRAGTMIRQATTPEQAAAMVDQYYERSNGHARQRRMQLAASFAGNVPVTAGQQPVQTPASSAPALAQASTERVVADREQMRNTQILLDTFNARLSQRPGQPNEQAAARQSKKQEQGVAEVPLRSRILEAFNYLTQAS
jgi:hypothetical protein